MKHLLIAFLLSVQFNLTAQANADSPIVYVCPPCGSNCDLLVHPAPGVCEHCNMTLISKDKNAAPPERLKIAFYLQQGVEVLDFAGPMEVFSYAGFEVFTVSKTEDPIVSQGILTIQPDYSIANAPDADILAFFGGNAASVRNDTAVIKWVKQQEDIDYHFSVCTGAFVLAEAGILNGKTATTFHSALNELEDRYPEIEVRKDVRYVDNGKVISTAGISAGIDGALHLVAKLNGFNEARRIAYQMEYDKWTPAEGLLLAENDIYATFKNVTGLEEYTGEYDFPSGQPLRLYVERRENSLYALIDQQKYPLYYLSKDRFQSQDGQFVTFERDAKGRITGYRSTADDSSTLFRKH